MFELLRTENNLKPHEKVYKNKDFCGTAMPAEKKKMLEFNQYMKLDKMSYIIYADIESWIRKIDEFAINPEKFSTVKIGENVSCEYSMSNIWGFDRIENKHALYRRKDCMKKVLWFLKRTSQKYSFLWK